MEQKEPFVYTVSAGERISIEIDPQGLSAQVRAAENGTALQPLGPDARPRFEFTVSEPPGNSHFVEIWYQFPPDTPNDARYDVKVHGTPPGGTKTSAVDQSITKRGPSDEPSERQVIYDFRV